MKPHVFLESGHRYVATAALKATILPFLQGGGVLVNNPENWAGTVAMNFDKISSKTIM